MVVSTLSGVIRIVTLITTLVTKSHDPLSILETSKTLNNKTLDSEPQHYVRCGTSDIGSWVEGLRAAYVGSEALRRLGSGL